MIARGIKDLKRQLQDKNGTGVFVLLSLGIYILIQNFFKWIPFAAGHTGFSLGTVQDNIVSIAASLILFCIICACLIRKTMFKQKFEIADVLAGGFCVFLLVQSVFRDSKLLELVRSLALTGSILSSMLVGKYFSASLSRITCFFKVIKWTMLVSIFLGFLVAVLKPNSVDWGTFAGVQCLGKMFCRTEFFFFAINPLFVVVLLWRWHESSQSKTGRTVFDFTLNAICIVAVSALVVMTRTRQFTLTIFFAAIVSFALWAKNQRRIWIGVTAALAVALLIAGPQILKFFMEYSRITPEPSAIAVDARAGDWTSGRMQLIKAIWEIFKNSPLTGLGGVKIRETIWAANLTARTEHGFIFYLGAYGVFGLLFVGYLLLAFGRGVRTLWKAFRNQIDVNSPQVTIALIAVPLIPFGFFGLFGSATNPSDFLSLMIASLVISSGRQQVAELTVETE